MTLLALKCIKRSLVRSLFWFCYRGVLLSLAFLFVCTLVNQSYAQEESKDKENIESEEEAEEESKEKQLETFFLNTRRVLKHYYDLQFKDLVAKKRFDSESAWEEAAQKGDFEDYDSYERALKEKEKEFGEDFSKRYNEILDQELEVYQKRLAQEFSEEDEG